MQTLQEQCLEPLQCNTVFWRPRAHSHPPFKPGDHCSAHSSLEVRQPFHEQVLNIVDNS